jgi:hypothetical protein
MGTFAEFKCKCGYEAYGKWGFGMNPIYREQGISLAPALCRDCRELVSINENAVLLHCPSCKGIHVVLYSDPSLGQVRRKSVIRSRPVHRTRSLMTIQNQSRMPNQTIQMRTMMSWTLTICSATKSKKRRTTSVESTRPTISVPSVIDLPWKRDSAGCSTEGLFRCVERPCHLKVAGSFFSGSIGQYFFRSGNPLKYL